MVAASANAGLYEGTVKKLKLGHKIREEAENSEVLGEVEIASK